MEKEWKLDKYFYSSIKDENLEKDLDTYKKESDIFIQKYTGRISQLNDSDFLEFLEELDVLGNSADKVLIYLGLLSSMDTQNQSVQKEVARVHKELSEYSEKFLFIDEEYKKIGFERFYELSKKEIFNPFKNYLVNSGKNIQYTLSEPEEKVIIKLSNASSNNLHEELTTSFEFKIDDNILTEDEVRNLRYNSNRDKRKKAWETIAETYSVKQNKIVLGNLYSLVCRENVATLELRKYKSVISGRNISEEVSDETVNSLLKYVQNNYKLYHLYLSKKTSLIGLDTMELYDVFAPLPKTREDKTEELSFEEGWRLYKNTIEKIDPKLAEFSEEMLQGARISVYPKPGKTSGAYAQYAKSLPEFVLLNWSNTKGDVSTLAHELGHAFHGHLSKEQKSLVYSTPLILAETASIFNETLMFETLLEMTESQEEKNELICNRLGDICATIFRQVAYVSFEKRCHESFQKNEPLTFEDYDRIWLEEMVKFYGPGVSINEELIKSQWASIPHIFYTPFYCYTYAFGNLISLNLYQNFKNSTDKKSFIEKYHKFLSSGGSDTPENLLKNIFDMEFDEKFYSVAFSNIEDLIEKLK